MIQDNSKEEVLKKISKDRERTNILRKYEQQTIAFLVERIPSWISSDMLTAIGFLGSIITFLGFLFGKFIHPNFLLLGVAGYAVSWFGDSLDGRIAYYRNKPRKWYGFSLDITVDWLGIILMGAGFAIYADEPFKICGFLFAALYGWAMITALIKYNTTGKYVIDSGLLGPTEVRIIISLILILETIFNGSIGYISVIITAILLITNFLDARKLLVLADSRDKSEKELK